MGAIKVGIIGGAGYTGGELIRILLNHPMVDLSFVQSTSNAGNPLYQVHQDLIGETEIAFSASVPDLSEKCVDVVFFCSGHGEAKKFINDNPISPLIKLIDIGNDFRLAKDERSGDRLFVYGLPEMQKEKIAATDSIANPGCFATAIQLGLLPLAKEGLLKNTDVYTTGITGSTGAGQSLSLTSHFSWRTNNIQAYKTLTHQHNAEIVQSIVWLQGESPKLHFVPWRGDFARGIFVSSVLDVDLSLEELQKLYTEAFKIHPFTTFSPQPIHLKQVVNTNKCVINIERHDGKTVVHSAIDNLVKGASGQAVQNMNIMFGFEETLGLKLKANFF